MRVEGAVSCVELLEIVSAKRSEGRRSSCENTDDASATLVLTQARREPI